MYEVTIATPHFLVRDRNDADDTTFEMDAVFEFEVLHVVAEVLDVFGQCEMVGVAKWDTEVGEGG